MSPQRKELDLFQRGQIIGAWKCGASIRKIAQALNHPSSTVDKVIKAYNDHGYEKPPPREGRPRKMTDRDDRALRKVLKRNRRANIKEIRDDFIASTSTNVCEKTIRHHLHESGYYSRAGVRKPYINNTNRKKRLEWAKERKKWVNEWENVLWSDESKFELFKGDGKRLVWRKPHEKYDLDCLIPTVKSGQDAITVWGCFHKNGLGPLVRLDGKIKSKDYIDVLKNYLLPYISTLENRNITFQEDNAPIHTSKLTKKWKEENNIISLPWPAQSPDLNPIEHLWDVLERKIRARVPLPKNKEELWKMLQEEWLQINDHTIQTLINSMPDRVAAVVKSKGNPTKY